MGEWVVFKSLPARPCFFLLGGGFEMDTNSFDVASCATSRGIEGMFQDMEISKALAEVFESKPEAKEILEDSQLFQLKVLLWGLMAGNMSSNLWLKSFLPP